MSEPTRVAVFRSARIPFARAHTVYRRASNQEMMTATLKSLVERTGLVGERLGDVCLGAVIKHSRDWNLARESTLGSGLDRATPGVDVQRACGTSLEAAINIANKIAAGQIDAGIAGGTDSISDAPVVFNDDARHAFYRLAGARGFVQQLAAGLGLIRFRHLKPQFPDVVEPRTGLSMGESCELMVKDWRIERSAQDELTLTSHQRAAAAYDSGFYNDLIVPFRNQSADNNVRRDSSIEKLASLRPVFDRSETGTLTAGNSTPLTDGASAALLGSEAWGRERGLEPEAFLKDAEVAAVDFIDQEGLLMAPAYAVSRLLERNGLSLQDFDFYEIHEAFAGQVLCTLKAWEDASYCKDRLGRSAPLGSIDREKLNVKGGSVALGHPFAATGTRVLGTAAKLLKEKGSGRALISVCTAGGMGVVAILER